MAQFNRPPRLLSPLPKDVVKLPKIPAISKKNGSIELLTTLLPFVAIIFMAVIMFAFTGGGGSMTSYLLFIPIMALSYLASFLTSSRQKKENERKLEKARNKLRSEILSIEEKLSNLQKEEYKKRLRNDPGIDECLKRVQNADPRLGERRPDDEDFLNVRVGTGKISPSYKIQKDDSDEENEEFAKEAESIQNLQERFDYINEAPIVVSLTKIGSLGICGDKTVIRRVTYSIFCQIMTHHWLEEVNVAAICSADASSEWRWLEKTPHSSGLMMITNLAKEKDSKKTIARVFKELELEIQQREQTYEAKKLLKRDDDNSSKTIIPLPRLVIVFDEMESAFDQPTVNLLLEKGKDLGVYGIFLTSHPSKVPGGCGAVVTVSDNKLKYKASGVSTVECVADQPTLETMEAFSQSLADIPFPSGGASSQPPDRVTFLQMFNARHVEDLPIEEWWNQKNPYGYLRAPIGKTSQTSDWIFDLNDRDGAHGPHGLLGGMTGSGKSEVLKSIILALAVTHHPFDLNFALIDFKGGAAFNELKKLPHTVGVVTDIESNATYAERVIQSLTGEIERRKKVLENARGIFGFGRSHVDEYREKLRTRRPLPRLLIVFDEFAEFKTRNPTESRKLIGIARQGRSLGVHLLLATQNIAAAIDPEIMQNSTYRICLRVSDPQDSVQMIGIPDAITLKRGRAYFSVSSRVLFQSAYSGAEYHPDNQVTAVPNSITRIFLDGHRDSVSMLVWNKPEQNNPIPVLSTEAAAVVDYLAETARRMGLIKPPPVWQDALPDRLYLPDIQEKNLAGGWDGKTWQSCKLITDRYKPLRTVFPFLGHYDYPQDQSQPYYQIDPSQGGNILIFGSAGSGKSTLLRTMITSLAVNHTPNHVHIYILDYGGQSNLKVMESFPHVGAVITRLESERTERLLGYLSAEIMHRNTLMRKAKVDNWEDYNDQTEQNEKFPAVFLIIDGFLNLKDAFESAISKKIVMLVSGQSAGIYLAISSYTQTDLPNELLANINSRISFYQANPNEYQGIVGFPSEACLQEDAVLGMRPGRGLLRGTTPLAFQAALPTYGENDKEVTENISMLSSAMRDAWLGKPTPPEICALEEFIYLPPVAQEKNKRDFRAEIGYTYQDLQPIGFTLGQDSNAFLVSSTSPGCGKTTFLQMWLMQLVEKYPFDQLKIKIIGYHSQSLGEFRQLPNVEIIRVKSAMQGFLNDMEKIVDKRKLDLESRIQSEVERFDQKAFLREYSHILIIIDDYGKFSASINDNERTQLIDILQNGDDVGISFIVADSMADLPKLFQDSFLQKFSLSGCGVLLGGTDGIDLFNNARITPGQPSIGLPAGRGYLIRRGRVNLFQAGVWWQQNEDPENTLQHRLANIIEK